MFYSLSAFLAHVYPPQLILQAITNHQAFHRRAILAVQNNAVAAINAVMLEGFPSKAVELVAVNSAEVEDNVTIPL